MSATEVRVRKWMRHGWGLKKIAKKLHLTPAAVAYHQRKVNGKPVHATPKVSAPKVVAPVSEFRAVVDRLRERAAKLNAAAEALVAVEATR